MRTLSLPTHIEDALSEMPHCQLWGVLDAPFGLSWSRRCPILYWRLVRRSR
jgi:hypothetical protein